MRAHPELAAAVRAIVDKIDASITQEYAGPPIRMFIAGGIAVNFYCGLRYTGDMDASVRANIEIDLPGDRSIAAAARFVIVGLRCEPGC